MADPTGIPSPLTIPGVPNDYPKVEAQQNIIPNADLNVRGQYGRWMSLPSDIIPNLSVVSVASPGQADPKWLAGPGDGSIYVTSKGGGGGGTVTPGTIPLGVDWDAVHIHQFAANGQDFTDLSMLPSAVVYAHTSVFIPDAGQTVSGFSGLVTFGITNQAHGPFAPLNQAFFVTASIAVPYRETIFYPYGLPLQSMFALNGQTDFAMFMTSNGIKGWGFARIFYQEPP